MMLSDDNVAAFEDALVDNRKERVKLQLFVAGMGPRSTRAVAHARDLVRLLGDRCSIEIVDIYESPGAARESQVIAVPALVRNSPKPVRKLIGAVGDALQTARRLGLVAPTQEVSP
jgi:circadian clock protein KaiB